MKYRNPLSHFILSLLCGLLFSGSLLQPVRAQSKGPLSNQEFVRLIYQLPAHPEKRDEIVEEIRQRGINFELTNGLRSLVATKSGNDTLLRRTLEEAARRRLNPLASALPSETEAREVLAQARTIALAVTGTMPDFVVKQLITRSYALGKTKNWIAKDHLTVAVSYRESAGEQYKLLAVNGFPTGTEEREKSNYEQAGGTSSTGEFVALLAEIFAEKSQTHFQAVDTDTLRGRRAIVYEFEVKQQNSSQRIIVDRDRSIIVGHRGKLWIDRENYRVLRIENTATDIPADFPVTAESRNIDYDWVTIAERQYLLPSRSEIEMTAVQGREVFQTRNEVRFRNYQKFGSEVKILDDDDIVDQEAPKKKP